MLRRRTILKGKEKMYWMLIPDLWDQMEQNGDEVIYGLIVVGDKVSKPSNGGIGETDATTFSGTVKVGSANRNGTGNFAWTAYGIDANEPCSGSGNYGKSLSIDYYDENGVKKTKNYNYNQSGANAPLGYLLGGPWKITSHTFAYYKNSGAYTTGRKGVNFFMAFLLPESYIKDTLNITLNA